MNLANNENNEDIRQKYVTSFNLIISFLVVKFYHLFLSRYVGVNLLNEASQRFLMKRPNFNCLPKHSLAKQQVLNIIQTTHSHHSRITTKDVCVNFSILSLSSGWCYFYSRLLHVSFSVSKNL